MIVKSTKTFRKQYSKLAAKLQGKFDERLRLFVLDQSAPTLRIHPLKGKYTGYFSMDVTGDLRALFLYQGDDIIILGFIGTHSQLY